MYQKQAKKHLLELGVTITTIQNYLMGDGQRFSVAVDLPGRFSIIFRNGLKMVYNSVCLLPLKLLSVSNRLVKAKQQFSSPTYMNTEKQTCIERVPCMKYVKINAQPCSINRDKPCSAFFGRNSFKYSLNDHELL